MTIRQNLIDYVIKYNVDNGKNITYKEMIKVFKQGHITKNFKTFTNLLKEAGIDRCAKILNCKICNKEFKKDQKEIDKSKSGYHFCSHSCSAIYSNKYRADITQETRDKISVGMKNHIKNNTNKMLKEDKDKIKNNTILIKDKVEFTVINGSRRLIKILICKNCKKEFKGTWRLTCSNQCLKIIQIKAGLSSQESQPKRSKGEILFYELCCKYFKNESVLSNPSMFIDKNNNKWDMDIVIPKYKIAIAYNGIYHYQQIGTKHKLKQVQSRDNIKKQIVFNNGYIFYEIKDLGKYNIYFVYKEFHKFIFNVIINLDLLMYKE
jgi:hypothetical protein